MHWSSRTTNQWAHLKVCQRQWVNTWDVKFVQTQEISIISPEFLTPQYSFISCYLISRTICWKALLSLMFVSEKLNAFFFFLQFFVCFAEVFPTCIIFKLVLSSPQDTQIYVFTCLLHSYLYSYVVSEKCYLNKEWCSNIKFNEVMRSLQKKRHHVRDNCYLQKEGMHMLLQHGFKWKTKKYYLVILGDVYDCDSNYTYF